MTFFPLADKVQTSIAESFNKAPVRISRKAYHSSFNELIPENASLQQLAGGFRFVEGPVWLRKEKALIFSDIPGNALYRWNKEEGISLQRSNSYLANGNALDGKGNLITCEHGTSRVTKTEPDGTYTVLVQSYNGSSLNSPNDVAVSSSGRIYFTDPNPGRSPRVGIPRPQELSFQGVYLYDPMNAYLHLLDNEISKPNGLCFSPDEEVLYVNDSDSGIIYSFDVDPAGFLRSKKVFAEIHEEVIHEEGKPGKGKGVVDGMKVNRNGYLFTTGPGGIYVLSPEGEVLGQIYIPETAANLSWGDNERTLFITASSSVYLLQW